MWPALGGYTCGNTRAQLCVTIFAEVNIMQYSLPYKQCREICSFVVSAVSVRKIEVRETIVNSNINAFIRTFTIVIKILNTVHNFSTATCFLNLRKQAVCFRNVLYCVEEFYDNGKRSYKCYRYYSCKTIVKSALYVTVMSIVFHILAVPQSL
jgi:hypothetical protein